VTTPQSIYAHILAVVRLIPPGRAASYGQIAWIVNAATPRMVGYAMAGLPAGSDVPWQRVINSQGGISPRGDPLSSGRQRALLEEEGVVFGPASQCRSIRSPTGRCSSPGRHSGRVAGGDLCFSPCA